MLSERNGTIQNRSQRAGDGQVGRLDASNDVQGRLMLTQNHQAGVYPARLVSSAGPDGRRRACCNEYALALCFL